jgi:molybdate transport system substrate-binding protein
MKLCRLIIAALPLIAFAANTPCASAREVRLFAAGSLKSAMTDLSQAFVAVHPQSTFAMEFGASGLLRARIEKGEAADVFASADTNHPAALAAAGRTTGPVLIFARNELCALAKPELKVTSATLVDVLLDPTVRLGISTPKADPSGDYALALFGKVGDVRHGSKEKLEGKAQQLTGGPNSPKAPDGKNLYAWVMSNGKVDIFLTYCTNARAAKAETPELQLVALPQHLAVSASYGLVVLKGAEDDAEKFAKFVLSEGGQAILAKNGFKPPHANN